MVFLFCVVFGDFSWRVSNHCFRLFSSHLFSNGMGIETGIDLDKLVEADIFINGILGRPTRSKVAMAISKKNELQQDSKASE